VLSSLISLVIIRIVVVTAVSYGLSQYSMEMVVRVLVLDAPENAGCQSRLKSQLPSLTRMVRIGTIALKVLSDNKRRTRIMRSEASHRETFPIQAELAELITSAIGEFRVGTQYPVLARDRNALAGLAFHPARGGGGTKPPNSRSINAANVIGVRSLSIGPMISTPIGRPEGEREIGATVAGSPGTVDTVCQTLVAANGKVRP
jgi:hypothetical protein